MVEFHQSKTEYDSAYMHNGERVNSFFRRFTPEGENGIRYYLKSVNVTGGASPEGSVSFNRYLSEKRADEIFSVIDEKELLPDSLVKFIFLGRDWNGLYGEVEKDMNVPYRAEVLSFIESNIGNDDAGDPLNGLKSLRGGVPYAYMYRNLFPSLRNSRLVVEYERLRPVNVTMENVTLMFPYPDPLVCPDVEFRYLTGSVKECKPFYLGLKTNLISDLLLIPHVGADLYVGKGWSVTADWMYGWWDKDRTHHYWRAYGGTVGTRKWLGRKAAEKPLTGHHIGVYAGIVTYDFEFGGRGYMGGKPHGTLWERCNFVGGVEYGYSMPVARRLNIDFTIGIGYLGGRYLEYVPKDGFYMWQSTHHLNWFGPTKAEVSLVWLIGCDNYNRRKGGRL